MKTRRPVAPRPRLEALEGRDQPSASLPLADTFAVGTDTSATTGSTAAAFTAGGAVFPLGSFSSFTPLEFAQREGGTNHFVQFRGGIRTAMADFTRDGFDDLVLAMGPTTAAGVDDPESRLSVVDGDTGKSLLYRFTPFEGFSGGLFVAVGDVNNDGVADLAVCPDTSGGPRVSIYTLTGTGFVRIANFFAIDDENFRGGCRPALGDIDGDGFDDLVVSAGFGGGPRISTYSGAALQANGRVHLVPDFFLFEQTLRNGAFVALGDITSDGRADLIGGGGPGGGPRVLIVDGRALKDDGVDAAMRSPVRSFFAGEDSSRGGVRVAAKRLDRDTFADLVTGRGDDTSFQVRIYSGAALSGRDALFTETSFNGFPNHRSGVFVG